MIVLDIETTGLSPKNAGIVSIGALDFHHPENTFYVECRVPKNTNVSDIALKINGFSKEEIFDESKPTEYEAIHEFLEWAGDIEDKTPAGENVSWDMGFLKTRYGGPLGLGYRVVDLHSVMYFNLLGSQKEPPLKAENVSSLSLNATREYLGLPKEPAPHNALTGALCVAECFYVLLHDESRLKTLRKQLYGESE